MRAGSVARRPVTRVAVAIARKDFYRERYYETLEEHFKPLAKEGFELRKLDPFIDAQTIDETLEAVDCVLFFVTRNFLGEDWLTETVVPKAVQLATKDQITIFFVHVESCDYLAVLRDLPESTILLPSNKYAISGWGRRMNDAWVEVINTIRVRRTSQPPSPGTHSVRGRPTGEFNQAVTSYVHEMVPIPRGLYLRGCSPDDSVAHEHEKPAHLVAVSPFLLSRTPVTQDLYVAVMSENPSQFLSPYAPVTNIKFIDAAKFCNKLSTLCGLEKAYIFQASVVTWNRRASGYRLPTEAEWEWAARGPRGATYPWGDAPPTSQLAWSGLGTGSVESARAALAAVDAHPDGASRFGVWDLSGNVFEWCWDVFEPYEILLRAASTNTLVDPQGPDKHLTPRSIEMRILRGGAYDSMTPYYVRATHRSADKIGAQDGNVGFRIACNSVISHQPFADTPGNMPDQTPATTGSPAPG
jgi:formylglycine-generating enzyme required for sulfatase activity